MKERYFDNSAAGFTQLDPIICFRTDKGSRFDPQPAMRMPVIRFRFRVSAVNYAHYLTLRKN